MTKLKEIKLTDLKILLFIFLLLSAFIGGKLATPHFQIPAFDYLTFSDIFLVLLMNLFVIFIWFALAHIGLFPVFFLTSF